MEGKKAFKKIHKPSDLYKLPSDKEEVYNEEEALAFLNQVAVKKQ